MTKAICKINCCFLWKKRFGYVGELTKTINKIEKWFVNNNNSKINNYKKRLEKTMSKIHNVTTKL